MDNCILQVAVFAPIAKLFDYLVPQQGALQLEPGMRVLVPFGKQKLYGIIVAINKNSLLSLDKLKSALAIVDSQALLSQKIQQLCIWASQYYHYPLGAVFETALPLWLRQGRAADWPKETVWQLSKLGKNVITNTTYKNAKRQKHIMSLLQENPQGLTEQQLNKHGGSKAVYNSLHVKGWIISQQIDKQTPKFIANALVTEQNIVLNSYQQQAIQTIKNNFHNFSTFFLDGVTGSGKTEVYMQLINVALANDQQTLILIPEIGLTPQTLARFYDRFNVHITILHSRLTDQEKFYSWLQARNGTAKIIIGTRSAAFLPMRNPGLFIIDEEHDPSFKQQDNFRYSARDLLIKRAQLEKCPIVLGSATPALETWHNAQSGRYKYLSLPQRAGIAQNPEVEILDIRHKKLNAGLSNKLLQKIEQHLAQKGQILLFLNRRGYSPVLICSGCGWHKKCRNCDTNMTFYSTTKQLRCHHCQYQIIVPKICPHCQTEALIPLGLGTQRIEDVLNKHFPTANIARIDRDSVQKDQVNFPNIIEQVYQGKIDILVGTQMLAKGHHFPQLSLVAILEVDGALFSADFRATERMGQLITQVAGRAGREQNKGTVLLQTYHPDHPLLQLLINKGYNEFLQELSHERKISSLPPFTYQALLRAKSKQEKLAVTFLQQTKSLIDNRKNNLTLLGPVLAPMAKRSGFYRAQLLLQAKQRSTLQIAIKQMLAKIADLKINRSIKWSLEIDPIDML